MEANKILLQKKYARIIEELAKEANISEEQAMSLFYSSKTYELVSQGISNLHCHGDGYLVDEILIEYNFKKDIGYY